MPLRAYPIASFEDTSIDTAGEEFAIPASSDAPFMAATAVKIYVSALARIGFGPDDSAPTVSDTNSVYQEAETEEVYTLSGMEGDDEISHIYVYADTGTVEARLSFFG